MSTTIIPNQIDEKPVENKEEQIISNGGEKHTDAINNIKLITREMYEALSPLQQKDWTKYDPSLQSVAVDQLYAMAQRLSTVYNRLGPTMASIPPLLGDTIDMFTDASSLAILQSLKAIMSVIKDTVGRAMEALKAFQELASVEIVGIVVQPIVSLFTLVFQMVQLLAQLEYILFKNPYNIIMSVWQTYESIDFEALKKQFEDLDNDSPDYPSITSIKREMDILPIPDEEVKGYLDECVKSVSKLKTQLDLDKKVSETSADLMKMAKTTWKDTNTTFNKCMRSFYLEALVPIPAEIEEALEKMDAQYDDLWKKMNDKESQDKESYAKKSAEFANNVNNYIKKIGANDKFIKNSDIELLRNTQQRLERNERLDDAIKCIVNINDIINNELKTTPEASFSSLEIKIMENISKIKDEFVGTSTEKDLINEFIGLWNQFTKWFKDSKTGRIDKKFKKQLYTMYEYVTEIDLEDKDTKDNVNDALDIMEDLNNLMKEPSNSYTNSYESLVQYLKELKEEYYGTNEYNAIADAIKSEKAIFEKFFDGVKNSEDLIEDLEEILTELF